MNAIAQKCRPKHQVLVLKCYPRITKGAVDVKPNSSELSYLLFYATSRRSKIQKIGNFLEKKTASDVWRLRIGNVQVTLGILKALIEKAPKDLPLFATNVLNILDQILRSKDITMVESSIPTFEAYCENNDASSLSADQAYQGQYKAIVKAYAALASTRSGNKPVEMRWRNVGLEAIKAIAEADALSSLIGRQLEVIVPPILENLWTDNDDFLDMLLQRVQLEEKIDADRLLRRRTSVATVRTADTAGDTNPIALSGTAFDVDKLAEEDIAVLAMQCLKQIFVVPNRPQIHGATSALLRFVEERVDQGEKVLKTDQNTGKDSGWAVKIFDLVARWAPVQDRFTILITAMDYIIKKPLDEATLPLHLILMAMVGSLLRSDVNMIGLSVMDVLLGLIQHMKRLLQLPGASTGWQASENSTDGDNGAASGCKELLMRIQRCLGELATHVYYADQISDMISTILIRLKPKRSSSASSSPRGEKADTGASNVEAESQHQVEAYFSANVGKVAALKAIKSILLIANPKTKLAGNMSLSRNRVPIQVWDGTHWLLHDTDGAVRKAYVDALLTWMDRETTNADSRAHEERLAGRSSLKTSRELSALARRANSNASNRADKHGKQPRTHFLQMLHMTIYDNALQFVEYETDIVLLHVLLAKLVSQLGVNAVRWGMPMVFRLQEDIQEVDAPIQKVRLGSLCHGYFWALSEKFDFEASVVGRAIHNEIIRRRSKNFWVEGVQLPPPMLELVGTPGLARPQPKMPLREIESEALLPFDDRISMVECVATGYQETAVSPPSSPAASPGRTFAHPVLGSTLSTSATAAGDDGPELPSIYREQMQADWSRDSALAALAAGSKSESLNGSRTGTTGTNPRQHHRLGVNGTNGLHHSPFGSQQNLRPSSAGLGLHGAKLRKSSVRSGVSPSPSASSRGYVAHIDQLKMVLEGHLAPGAMSRPATAAAAGNRTSGEGNSSSDSMVSYEFTPSELSFNPAGSGALEGSLTVPLGRSGSASGREKKDGPGPLTSHPMGATSRQEPDEDVPPLPPMPPDRGVQTQDHAVDVAGGTARKTSRRGVKSRGGEKAGAMPMHEESSGVKPGLDLQELLRGIDPHAREPGLGNLSRPPY